MRRSARLALMPIAVATFLAACSKQGKPSPEFAGAHELFARIYAEKLDDAYDDPRMEKVEQLLAEVPAASSDSPAARELSERIKNGRVQVRAEAQKRREAVAAARKPVDVPPFAYRSPLTEIDAGAADAVDAGPPRNPAPGMPYNEFVDRFSGCFRQMNSIMVEGRGMREVWELKDIANCRDRHPGFEEMIVVIDGNQILATVRKDSIQRVAVDGGSR